MEVEHHDAKKEECKKVNNSSALKHEKALMEGAYTELKKAHKKRLLNLSRLRNSNFEMRLTSKMQEAADEDEAVAA